MVFLNSISKMIDACCGYKSTGKPQRLSMCNSSLVITYTIRDLRVVTSSHRYTPYHTIILSYNFLGNGKEIVTLAYDQTYTKIGCTIVYTTGPCNLNNWNVRYYLKLLLGMAVWLWIMIGSLVNRAWMLGNSWLTWSTWEPTIKMGALGACTVIELSQKSRPACSYPSLTFHNNKYTALLDMKYWRGDKMKIYYLEI